MPTMSALGHNPTICSCQFCHQERAEWEAIRQTVNCPSCDGISDAELLHSTGVGDRCPYCTDGKISMARLLAVGAAAVSADWTWSNTMIGPSGSAAIVAVRDYLRAVKP